MNNELKERFDGYSYLEKISLLSEILKELKNSCDVPSDMENKTINESIVLVNQWQEILDIFEKPDNVSDTFCYNQINKKELLNFAEYLNDELEKSLYIQFHMHKLVEYKLTSLN